MLALAAANTAARQPFRDVKKAWGKDCAFSEKNASQRPLTFGATDRTCVTCAAALVASLKSGETQFSVIFQTISNM